MESLWKPLTDDQLRYLKELNTNIQMYNTSHNIFSMVASITLSTTSLTPGQTLTITACADTVTAYLTIQEPAGNIGFNKTITASTCQTYTITPTNSYPNGTYTAFLKDGSGTVLDQKSYTISGATGITPGITLSTASLVPGQTLTINACASSVTAYLTIQEPAGNIGFNKTITASTCQTYTITPTTSYPNGTYTAFLKDGSGTVIDQKSYTVSGAGGSCGICSPTCLTGTCTTGYTCQNGVCVSSGTSPCLNCDLTTHYCVANTCVPKSYVLYGTVAFGAILLLTLIK